MPQQVVHSHANRLLILLTVTLGTIFVTAGPGLGDDGAFRASPHGDSQTGVFRQPELPRGSCVQCHSGHDVAAGQPFGLFVPNSNELCFSASAGGCHADQPAGATAGYPAVEADRLPLGAADPGYFEFNSGGLRVPGVENLVRWPGRIIWENGLYSAHFSDQDMPLKDFFGNGACDNCHAVHGSEAPHDMLDTTYIGISGSQNGTTTENYALCLACHDVNGPFGMDDNSRSISYFYDRSINSTSGSGHGISTGGGYVPSGGRLPCYDCHNPHGSTGYGGQGANDFLLSDQRVGWYGLTDIRNNAEQARRFCLGCHPSADGSMLTESVEGLTLPALPGNVSAHLSTSEAHCYDCHGRDYSSPTANNVHNPSPGGDCVTCHADQQAGRRPVMDEFGKSAHHAVAIGATGTPTNEDCVVCHMEGNAATTAPDQMYHGNGLLDLRDPDNGMALIGFENLTRDRQSPILETWVVDVQNQFCLGCHDNNGAMSPLARVPGGTALSPFTDQNAQTIDVASQFAISNAASHPVLAPGNNPYTVPSAENNFTTTMLPPFNQTSIHDVISCFDCHETNGHGFGNSGMLLTETFFREPVQNPNFASAQRALCGTCHDESVYIFSSEPASRFTDHDKGPHAQPQGGGQNNQACRGCHAGIYDSDLDPTCDNGSGIGLIHGVDHTFGACSPTPGSISKHFIVGGYISGWQENSPTSSTCYANCHHASGEGY